MLIGVSGIVLGVEESMAVNMAVCLAVCRVIKCCVIRNFPNRSTNEPIVAWMDTDAAFITPVTQST